MVSSDTSALLYRIHRINANLLQAIVVLHVAMIVVYLLWARRDLVTPMIVGRTRDASVAPDTSSEGAIAAGGSTAAVVGKGVACALVALVAVGLTVGWF